MFCNQYAPPFSSLSFLRTQDQICCDENSFCMFTWVSSAHRSNSSQEVWWEFDKSTGYLSVSHRMWGEVSRDTFFSCERDLQLAGSKRMSSLFKRRSLTRFLLMNNIKQNHGSTICSKPPKEMILLVLVNVLKQAVIPGHLNCITSCKRSRNCNILPVMTEH